MRALFLNPPTGRGPRRMREGRCQQRASAWATVWPPLSLARTAAVLRDDGMDVRICDGTVLPIGLDDLTRDVAAWQPDLVVFNAVTPTIESDLSLPTALRAVAPHARFAALGVHVTSLTDESFALGPDLDVIVRGEPEETVREWARAVRQNTDFADVSGISWRDGGAVRHNADRPFIRDLDALPFPAWDLVDRSAYRSPISGRPFVLVGAGRGCPYPCKFCVAPAYYGQTPRLPSPRRIGDEVERNLRDFGIREFLFWSDSFTLRREHALGIANEIEDRHLGVEWSCNSRVDHVDPDLLSAFRRAGCKAIAYGVESGTQAILDEVGKHVTLDQIRRAVLWTREAGIASIAHCVVGYPGETATSIRRTIEFVKELDVDFAQFYCATPLPGSTLFEEARTKGWITTADWSQFDQDNFILETDGLDAETVMRLRDEAYRRFYVRPKTVWRALRRSTPRGAVRTLAAQVRDFLSWA
ncbi:MAG: radical SAM protein [Planctomycetes bacterium]|nr:radical SAM protein [Planctomycetota bacterium]